MPRPHISILQSLLWYYAVAFIAILALLGWLVAPTGKGWIGEWWVKVYLRRLDPKVYHCLHDLLIKNAKGEWTQIDHVVVSPFGIFVIETKNYSGWIYGCPEAAAGAVS